MATVEERLASIEQDVSYLKGYVEHVATKADVVELRAEMSDRHEARTHDTADVADVWHGCRYVRCGCIRFIGRHCRFPDGIRLTKRSCR